MTLHIYRTHVAGFFRDLDDDTRARLLAEVDEHDALHAAFRPEGTLTYDRTLKAFRFRYEIRVHAETPGEAEETMVATAVANATRDLAAIGIRDIDPTTLRVEGTDMATTWRNR
jgi:hypothetical protein